MEYVNVNKTRDRIMSTSIKVDASLWASFKSECNKHQLNISQTLNILLTKAMDEKTISVIPNKNQAWEYCVRMREIISRLTDKNQLLFYEEEMAQYYKYLNCFNFKDNKLVLAANKLMKQEMKIPEKEAKAKCLSIFNVIVKSQNLKETKKLVGFHNLWRYMDYLNKYKWSDVNMFATLFNIK